MWVRLPPRAPFFLYENKSVNALESSVYPACTLRLGEKHRSVFPRTGQVRFKLVLASFVPRVVMAFRNPHALMTEQD